MDLPSCKDLADYVVRPATLADIPSLNQLDLTIASPQSLTFEFASPSLSPPLHPDDIRLTRHGAGRGKPGAQPPVRPEQTEQQQQQEKQQLGQPRPQQQRPPRQQQLDLQQQPPPLCVRLGPAYVRRYDEWNWGDLDDFRLHIAQGWVWVAESTTAESTTPQAAPIAGAADTAQVSSIADETDTPQAPPVSEATSTPPAASSNQVPLLSAKPPPKLLGLIEASEPTGRIWGHEVDDSMVELVSLFVDRSARRRGVGRALVQALIEAARTEHKELIITQAESGNLAAIRFYQSLGFVWQGIAFLRPGEPEQQETPVLMVCPVRPRQPDPA